MRTMLSKLSRTVRQDISRRIEGGVVQAKGRFFFSEVSLNILKNVSGLTSELLLNSDRLILPNVTYREKELSAFGSSLIDSLVDNQGKITFIAPVCPDYSQGEIFYQTVGEGISPQAKAAIKATQFIEPVLLKYGFQPKVVILVADTEDDLPEVMERCVNSEIAEYKKRCVGSVMTIKDDLIDSNIVEVGTFSSGFGDDFRQKQYLYERKINELRFQNEDIGREVQKLGDMRKVRHSDILGRKEVDYELTIRYMAQYAALGTIVRGNSEPTVLLNYPTPNLPFFNAATYRHRDFSISERDAEVVPVVVTKMGEGL